MKKESLIQGFVQLGKIMVLLSRNEDWQGFSTGITEEEYAHLQNLVNRQFFYNGWFTQENVRQSLGALGGQMTEEKLSEWLQSYGVSEKPKRVGIIMAGNIPLVGFNDFLCVLMSGNIAVCKLSSDDKTLLPALSEIVIKFCPELKDRIEFSTGIISKMDAVIATGSDNSVKYFEQYFGKYPHVFRKNRTSVAVLTGKETPEEINLLGGDIFSYFGLGCRNVSHLILPEGFDLNRFFEAIIGYSEIINHHKYANNYDYNKAVYLMNKQSLLDNNFVLLRESNELFSPLSMIHYHFYKDENDLTLFLDTNKEKIQVVVGQNFVPFGQAQCPSLEDYADGINTMDWLAGL